MKQDPVRTCIGCSTKKPQRELIRLGGGRGAYLCAAEECFEEAAKKKAFSRASRHSVSQEEINGYKKEFGKQLKVARQTTDRDRDGPR